MKKIKLEVIGLSYNPAMGNTYALVLEDLNENKRIPIIIGEPEAQSIIMVLEEIMPQRPMTHDLFVNLCVEHSIKLIEVIIYKMEDGVYFSKLVLEDYKGGIKEIDSRTSDAIALALRFGCPIYIYETIMEKCAINVTENDNIKPINKNELNPDNNINGLKKELEDAVKSENYERAAEIRDIIEKRKN